MKEIEIRASHLLSYLRFIITARDQRYECRDMESRWILFISTLCFTYKPHTCVRWPTMWGIQLHANGIKRRVIESLFHTGLKIGYKTALDFFKKIALYQKKSLKTLGRENRFIRLARMILQRPQAAANYPRRGKESGYLFRIHFPR